MMTPTDELPPRKVSAHRSYKYFKFAPTYLLLELVILVGRIGTADEYWYSTPSQ